MDNENTLFIFIDESGNFDFSPSGTGFFVLTAVATRKPLKGREAFQKLRYQLLVKGNDQEYFHATEDKQFVRDGFFAIVEDLKDFTIDSVVAQKNKTNPSLYLETYTKKGKIVTRNVGDEFYRIICQTLLQHIFKRCDKTEVKNIVVILSAIFNERRRKIIIKSLKTYLKRYTNLSFYTYFHDSRADVNCQIADYCCWAIYVKHERGETRPFKEIEDKIESEFDVFQRTTLTYY